MDVGCGWSSVLDGDAGRSLADNVAGRRKKRKTSVLPNFLFPKKRLQRFWNVDGSIFLLKIFQDGGQRASDGQAGPVQRTAKIAFFVLDHFKVHASRLKVPAR